MPSVVTKAPPHIAPFGDMGSRTSVRFTLGASRFLDLYAELLRPLSLSPGRVLALSFIDSQPGCTQSALAAAMRITKATAMAMVDRLEGLGLVIRAPGSDRRSNALQLTELGRTRFDEALALDLRLDRVAFGWMDEGQREAFAATVDRVARALMEDPGTD